MDKVSCSNTFPIYLFVCWNKVNFGNSHLLKKLLTQSQYNKNKRKVCVRTMPWYQTLLSQGRQSFSPWQNIDFCHKTYECWEELSQCLLTIKKTNSLHLGWLSPNTMTLVSPWRCDTVPSLVYLYFSFQYLAFQAADYLSHETAQLPSYKAALHLTTVQHSAV